MMQLYRFLDLDSNTVIILATVIPIVVVLIVVVAIVALVVPKLRRKVFPYRDRAHSVGPNAGVGRR